MKNKDRILAPDLHAAATFLNLLDRQGVFTFQTIDDNKDRHDGRLSRVLHGTLTEHATNLAIRNAGGAGIFVMVNEGNGVALEGNKTCRTNKNVVRVRSIFVDLDGAPLDPVISLPEQPSVVVESSPGRWHAYWHGVPCPLADFAEAQTSLATQFGGDHSVKDLARVMRLPGFWHQKGEPYLTRIVNVAEEFA